jgi:predicted ATPase
LKSIKIEAVRGMTADLEFSWPITAIAGTNGSGKTTILQLCSAAYVRSTGGRNYKIGDWVRAALKDETPAFSDSSAVTFSFWNDAPGFSIPYRRDRTRWNYPRRNNPERLVQFIGISTFAPRIERRDRLHVFRSQIEVKATAQLDNDMLNSMSKIMGVSYDSGAMHTVGLAKGSWSDELPVVNRSQYGYAEPHMGAGEQKVIRIMRALEALQKRSLILLEEPEITLHPDAQRGLAWYLMNLTKHKGHQIILTTHSSELFEALPAEARVLIIRHKSGVDVVPRAPYIAAARELSGVANTNKDLILVEDHVAQTLLTSIFEKCDRALLNNACIVPVGSATEVYQLVQTFRTEGVRAIGVRDPDIAPDPAKYVFSLPGNQAPEEILLEENNIKAAEAIINGVGAAMDKVKASGLGLAGSKRAKALFQALSNELGVDSKKLYDRLIIAWLTANDAAARQLVQSIKDVFG